MKFWRKILISNKNKKFFKIELINSKFPNRRLIVFNKKHNRC